MNAALGANWCNAARAFMFSLGCVQSLQCHTGNCPTGVATSSPARQRGLVIPEKAQRVANFQSKTLDSLHDIVVACGLETPDDFTPRHLRQWKNNSEMIPWSQIVQEVEAGKLLSERRLGPPVPALDLRRASVALFYRLTRLGCAKIPDFREA